VLLANTLQATVAQFTLGVLIALTPFYAKGITAGLAVDEKAAYGFLEAAIGAGNLIGGFAIGFLGSRLARGKTVIVGYTVLGACVMVLGLIGNLGLAIGLMFGIGVANMVFVIPSQTMFQERTPAEMLGRVVGFRFALVFGSMTIAMAISGLLAASVGTAVVFILFGMITVLAGLAGLLVPAVRDA
jgi:MFS family permease